MLNELVADYVREALQPMHGETAAISRLEGLVKVLSTDYFTEGKISKFPIAVSSTVDTCTSSGRSFPDLCPNDEERLIVYFEDQGASSKNGRWVSRLRLVGWGNSTLFLGVDSAAITAVLISKIQNRLKKMPVFADSPIIGLQCSITGSPPATQNLFSQYSYNELNTQYLFYPYFAFGLDLELTYNLTDITCDTELIGLTPDSCN